MMSNLKASVVYLIREQDIHVDIQIDNFRQVLPAFFNTLISLLLVRILIYIKKEFLN